MRKEIKNRTLRKEVKVLTDFCGPRFECRIKLMIANLKKYCQKNAGMSCNFSRSFFYKIFMDSKLWKHIKKKLFRALQPIF